MVLLIACPKAWWCGVCLSSAKLHGIFVIAPQEFQEKFIFIVQMKKKRKKKLVKKMLKW
jgi:hypothetical protein